MRAKQSAKDSEGFKFAPIHPSPEQIKINQQLDPLTLALNKFHVTREMPSDRKLAKQIDKYRHRTKVSGGIVLIEATSHAPTSEKNTLYSYLNH